MPTTILRLLALTALAALLAACNGGTSQPPPSEQAVIVSEDVSVLDASARQNLTNFDLDLTNGSGELRFTPGGSGLASIAVGDVLASQPVPGVAEHGFLQRIVERRDEGGEVVFVTQAANLEDAFDRAEIEFSREFTASDVVDTTAFFEGVSLRVPDEGLSGQQLSLFNFEVDFNEVLIEGEHGTLELDGSFLFNVSADADISITLMGLQHFEFLLAVEEAAEVKLTGDFNAEFSEEIDVLTLNLGSFTVPVGPVPVVFSFGVTVVVGASGQISAHLEIGATQSVELDLGARYTSSGGWQNLSEFNQDFDFPPPDLTATAAARAYAGGRFAILIYGLAGPYAYANASVNMDAELFRDPFWRLSACLDAGLGLNVTLPIIGELADWNHELAEACASLGESQNRAPEVTITAPEDTSSFAEGTDITLRYLVQDFEQSQIAVTVSASPGGQLFSGNVSTGQQQSLSLPANHLCPGTRTYTVSATDSRNARHEQSTTVTVLDHPTTVTMNTGVYQDAPVYANNFIFGSATADSRNCTRENSAEHELIEWYLDDTLIGEGSTLAHLLDSHNPGDTVTLQARYTEDGVTVVSETAEIEIASLPNELIGTIQAVILEPEDGEWYGCGPFARDIRGMAYVLGSSTSVPAGNLEWHVRYASGTGSWIQVATGGETTFTLPSSLLQGDSSPSPYHLRLTASHDGQSGEAFVTFTEYVCG